MDNIKVYGEFYSCSANRADYEIMIGMLKRCGFEIVDSPKKSTLNLLVTCSVKTPTADKMVFRIKEFTKTGKPLIVAGCFAKAEPGTVAKLNPSASLVGPNSVDKILNATNAALESKKYVDINSNAEKPNLAHARINPIIEITQINSGCLSSCSFCETKLARGDLRSYRPDKIRDQVRNAVSEGCKEVWLTSQDTSAYGRDINTNLAELLHSITNIEGDFLVRVGMMNPLHFNKVDLKKLIGAYRSEKVFKFLHLCVQSGSDNVLKGMERGYKVGDFVEYVRRFRKEIHGLTLETDIIVGFPTETEKDFKKTARLIEDVKPDAVNISKYGARPNTPAAMMRQLEPEVISERSRAIHGLVERIKMDNNKKWLSWEGEVLVDEAGTRKGTWMARNFTYKPIVLESEKNLLGKFINVKISDAKGNYLMGSL